MVASTKATLGLRAWLKGAVEESSREVPSQDASVPPWESESVGSRPDMNEDDLAPEYGNGDDGRGF